MIFKLLCATEVLSDLAPDQCLRPFVLLIYGFESHLVFLMGLGGVGVENRTKQTFECKHEVVERILVLFVRFGVVLFLVFVYCDLHELDRTLTSKNKQIVSLGCYGEMTGLRLDWRSTW